METVASVSGTTVCCLWKHILELRFLRKELFMNTLKYLFTCLYLLTLPLGALAQQVESYLTVEQLPDAVSFLPPPPAEGTPQAEADKAIHHWMKSLRSGERGVRAAREAMTNVDTMAAMFSGAFGRELSREKTPRTMDLLYRSIRTFRLAASHPKKAYMRVRPYVYFDEGTLVPGDEEEERHTGSYPSGHTSRGWGMALVLAQLNPERQDTILSAGYEWGQSRVIAGYHWQSDVDAARLMTSATFARLQDCPEYMADLTLAREELFPPAAVAAAVEHYACDERGPIDVVMEFTGDVAGKIPSAAGIGILTVHVRAQIAVDGSLRVIIGGFVEVFGVGFAQ